MKDVFTIVENPKGDKDFWIKVGVAFANKDGSENIKLSALPVNGTLHVRDRKENNE